MFVELLAEISLVEIVGEDLFCRLKFLSSLCAALFGVDSRSLASNIVFVIISISDLCKLTVRVHVFGSLRVIKVVRATIILLFDVSCKIVFAPSRVTNGFCSVVSFLFFLVYISLLEQLTYHGNSSLLTFRRRFLHIIIRI